MISDYKVVKTSDINSLEVNIKELLAKGWQFKGKLIVRVNRFDQFKYHQVMVRREEVVHPDFGPR